MTIQNESKKLLSIFSKEPTHVDVDLEYLQWDVDGLTYTISFKLEKNKYVAPNYVERAVLLDDTYYDDNDDEKGIPEDIVDIVWRYVNEAVMDYIANNETSYVSDGYNEQMREAYEWEETCKVTNAWLNSQSI